MKVRLEAARAALGRVEHVAAELRMAPEQVRRMHELYEDRLSRIDRVGDGSTPGEQLDAVELVLIQAERDYINAQLRMRRIGDEIRRRIERDLDLREEAIRRSRSNGNST